MTVKRYDIVNTTYQGEAWREMEESDDGDYVLASDYDALAAERDRWKKVASDVCGHMDIECPPGCDSYGHVEGCGVYDLCVTVKNLRKRLAGAELYAKRYLWLRDGNSGIDGIDPVAVRIAEEVNGEEWDAAIDAAMATADQPPVCPNCDVALPEGCGGLFKDDGEACWLNRSVAADQPPAT